MVPAAIGIEPKVEIRVRVEIRYPGISAPSLSRNGPGFASVVPRVRPSQERLGIAIGQSRSTSSHIAIGGRPGRTSFYHLQVLAS